MDRVVVETAGAFPQRSPHRLAATSSPDRASKNTLLATTGWPAVRSRRITGLSMYRLETTSTSTGASGSKAMGTRPRLVTCASAFCTLKSQPWASSPSRAIVPPAAGMVTVGSIQSWLC